MPVDSFSDFRLKATCCYLVEFENIEQFEQFPVLFVVLEFYVVLLESVQREFRLVVDVHFHRLDVTILNPWLNLRENLKS